MSAFTVRLLAVTSQEEAERELARIGVDPRGIGMMSPKMLIRCVHLSKLLCRQANILKQEMLGLGGDAAVARGTVACSIDRTDVILTGTEKQLRRLCEKLAQQPFGLADLAADLTALLTNVSPALKTWKTARRDLLLDRPLIMGILNATPDSFSDGGSFIDPHKAVEHALEMEAEGADIIDIGGESTRPGAPAVPAAEELRRVAPIIEHLAGRLSRPISVDTWKSEVARGALAAGAEIINDISGFGFDPAMAPLAAESGAGVVLQHTRGTPDRMQTCTDYEDLLGEVIAGLRSSVDSAVTAGVERERIVIDPGIGFAKDTAGNLELLRRLRELTSLGLPLLVGTSRKTFIGKTLGRETGERMVGTAATVALAVANGASIVRVHDVREMRDAADMAHAIITS
ncbi:dihydropteroate synthase [Oryzomonas sagensis]|uniref:dihydropteroate synthase n=1 Tax=Oryzomonas sagensis TaxID=2603857 RepID=A0ABQ6TM04_9BACT|nr:dihydropteroate synthase [Oryzomonas sagensis]